MRKVGETMTATVLVTETGIETAVIGGDIPGPAALTYVLLAHTIHRAHILTLVPNSAGIVIEIETEMPTAVATVP